jgi:RimJ/RimL family protein N-acetyltransferase
LEDLLALEIDTIHGLRPGDGVVRRLRRAEPLAVLAWSPGARVLAVGDRAAAFAALDDEPFAPEIVPAAVLRLARALAATAVTGGPSFVFPDALPELPARLPIVGSDAEGRAAARSFRRPDNWEPDEWLALIAGEIGEWAMALDGEDPVSICHTPASTDESADAGTWTRADHRRKGLAAATARAWSLLERRRRRVLFYSTAADNHASRGVARRLGLRPLGWLWTIR